MCSLHQGIIYGRHTSYCLQQAEDTLQDRLRTWVALGRASVSVVVKWFYSCSTARFYRPHDQMQVVVDIDGDGSFLMNCQELATIFIEKLDVKCFIMNNQHLGMVVQWEDRFYKKNRAHTYLGHRVSHVTLYMWHYVVTAVASISCLPLQEHVFMACCTS